MSSDVVGIGFGVDVDIDIDVGSAEDDTIVAIVSDAGVEGVWAMGSVVIESSFPSLDGAGVMSPFDAVAVAVAVAVIGLQLLQISLVAAFEFETAAREDEDTGTLPTPPLCCFVSFKGSSYTYKNSYPGRGTPSTSPRI